MIRKMGVPVFQSGSCVHQRAGFQMSARRVQQQSGGWA
jgi:hypothetical protein